MTHHTTNITVSTPPASSEGLWAAYMRQNQVEDRAWQLYEGLSHRTREAFVAWSLAKQCAEQAYVAFRRCQQVERSRHGAGMV
jgi:hypothetical protein